MDRVTSRQNPLVKEFRALLNVSRRHSARGGRRVLLEGVHLLQEALASGLSIEIVAGRADLLEGSMSALAQQAESSGARLVTVNDAVLSAISPVRQPSGVVSIARCHLHSLDLALGRTPQLLLFLSDIQDPGNVGAIVRVADGCGATAVITSDATADPFGWKALRGSMGSAFHMPVVALRSIQDATRQARDRAVRLFAAVPRDGTPLLRCDLRSPSAVLLGGEGSGLPRDILELADEPLTIPMRSGIESLNVATAAAIIVFEAQRQRREEGS